MEEEHIHQLQLRVLSGLISKDGDKSTLADFHKNVVPETFIDPTFVDICRAAKDLYSRTGDCDPVTLLSEISTKRAQFRIASTSRGTSILLEASRSIWADSVSLSQHLPLLQRIALSKYLPMAQKELENDVKAGIDYNEAYAKHVAPVIEKYSYKGHTRFDIDAEVAELKQKVEGFKQAKITLERIIPTGFKQIDSAMRGGMRPSQLIIIGARPATGKTTMSLNIATNVIEATKKHVVFVSLEQTSDQLVEKIVSIKSQIQFPKTKEELDIVHQFGQIEKIDNAVKTFPFHLLHVVEKTDDIENLYNTVKELCRKHEVAAVVIDYLQLIPIRGRDSRYEGITKISNKLKVLAKEADVPIVCLAQLSRNSDNENRTPRMADLRDSGSIEQDADIGILLYNDNSITEEEAQIASMRRVCFDIQKNRNGSLMNVKLKFLPAKSTFIEL